MTITKQKNWKGIFSCCILLLCNASVAFGEMRVFVADYAGISVYSFDFNNPSNAINLTGFSNRNGKRFSVNSDKTKIFFGADNFISLPEYTVNYIHFTTPAENPDYADIYPGDGVGSRLAFSPDGLHIYTPSVTVGIGAIFDIDADTGIAQNSSYLAGWTPYYTNDIVYSEFGLLATYTNGYNLEIALIDPATLVRIGSQIIRDYPGGARGIETFDNKIFWATDDSIDSALISESGLSFLRTYQTPLVENFTVSSKNEMLAVTSYDAINFSSQIVFFDIESGTTIDTIQVPSKKVYSIEFSPTGSHLVFTTLEMPYVPGNRAEVAIMDINDFEITSSNTISSQISTSDIIIVDLLDADLDDDGDVDGGDLAGLVAQIGNSNCPCSSDLDDDGDVDSRDVEFFSTKFGS